MPNSIFVTILVEFALIIMTSILLMQPRALFKPEAATLRKVASWMGMIFLCGTFCWSIVLGVILSVNGLTIRI